MFLKNRLKRIGFKVVKPIALRLGFSEKKISVKNFYSKENLLENFFKTLLKLEFKAWHIVDVGANHGTWTREVLRYFPNSSYTLIEPQAWMKESINDLLESNPDIRFFGVGAGEKKGSFKFTIVDRDDSCSFSYSETDALQKGFKQIDVDVITLNDFLPEVNSRVPDIIKIDAEGLDIEVLRGANKYFGKTEVFMVEVGIVNKTFNNSFLKMINLMDEAGYRLFDITDLNRPLNTNVLWLAELVFIKKNGFIDSKSFIGQIND